MSKTVLVVSDSGVNRQATMLALKASAYLVVEAIDGQDALDKARLQTVDLVITEDNLPRLDGYALTRLLRSIASYQQVPVLFLTSDTSGTVPAKVRAAGGSGWLVRPVDKQKILAIVKKIIA